LLFLFLFLFIAHTVARVCAIPFGFAAEQIDQRSNAVASVTPFRGSERSQVPLRIIQQRNAPYHSLPFDY